MAAVFYWPKMSHRTAQIQERTTQDQNTRRCGSLGASFETDYHSRPSGPSHIQDTLALQDAQSLIWEVIRLGLQVQNLNIYIRPGAEEACQGVGTWRWFLLISRYVN